ncbi:MAG: polyprenyl synthetase family protein, partial [Rubritepida sp.]|nr:polyprenyl synthetase family protein [Rubritepida sp.]
AGRPLAEEEALDAYGRNLGVAFQLVDDALDYAADEAVLGKTVGDDFREGKISLPVLVAFARGDEAERAFWRRTIETREQGPDDLAEAQRLIDRHGALAETFDRARGFGATALEALAPFPDGAEKRALQAVVAYCIERAR